MLTYILKRVFAMIPTLLGITFVTFVIITLAPGDPVAAELGGPGGEKGTDGGGGGNDMDRMADAIKAKKKLLGMMTEDRSLQLWDVDVERQAEVIKTEPVARWGRFDGWASALAVDLEGRVAVGIDTGELMILNAKGAEELTLEGHPEEIWALAFDATGARLASADIDGAIKVWDPTTGELVADRGGAGSPVRDLAFVPGGDSLLAAGNDGTILELAGADLSVRRSFKGHVSGVHTVTPSPDGSRFWSGGYDRKLREWDFASGEVLRINETHRGAINDIALSPDGSRLATAGDDRIVRVLSLQALEEPGSSLKGHYKRVSSVVFLGAGDRLASVSTDETFRVWDLVDEVQILGVNERLGIMNDLVLLADGRPLTAADSWKRVPIYRQYATWLWRIMTLDLGRSFVDDRPVIDKIARALPITLGLNTLALLIIYLVSIPLGVYAAVKRGTMFDHISSILLFILYSVPNFWLATLLIMFFSSKLNLDILPSVGLISDNAHNLSFLQWLWDGALHLVLPTIVMVYAGFASLSRYARTSLLETIGEDYIRTARAKGLDEKVVVYKHALRNSLITIVTLVANLLPAMIGGSVIVEYIFTIQGMGKLGFDAILSRDYPVIMAITTFSAFLTLLGILVSDLLYSVVDPRVTQD